MRIEKPDWKYDIVECEGFRQWWSDVIEPINLMLERGTELKQYEADSKSWWTDDALHSQHMPNKTALLINITEFKAESSLDVLKDALKDGGLSFKNQNRAKAAIERGE